MDLPAEREPGLEQGSFLKLLVIAWEGLSHELLTANTPGDQGTEYLSPEGDLGIWMTDNCTHFMSYHHTFRIWDQDNQGPHLFLSKSLSPCDNPKYLLFSKRFPGGSTNPGILLTLFSSNDVTEHNSIMQTALRRKLVSLALQNIVTLALMN